MKSIPILLISLCCYLVTQISYSQNHKLDTKKSVLFWTGKAAFNSYSLTGSIHPKGGTIVISNNTISNLQVVINMKSIDHENKDLKSHLKNEDFFEVSTYPEAIFSVDNGVAINDTIILKGKLTIKGKTSTEDIPVTLKQTTSGIIVKFEYAIDRTKYGVNHNSPSIFKRMKENAIADEFILKGTLVFKE